MRPPLIILTVPILCLLSPPLLAGQPQVRPVESPDVLPQIKTLVRSKACTIQTMDCGETVFGQIDFTDCVVDTGFWVDFWTFSGQAGDEVTINGSSTQFDTFLVLLDDTGLEPETVADDDNSGPGTDSRIVYTLGSSGTWVIGMVNNFSFNMGDYSLSLACESSSTPTPPAAPSNLTATTLSSTEIQLDWQDNSNNEEEFRVESRFSGSGSYQDIGSVSANSTAAIVSSLIPDTTYDYRVRARNNDGNSSYSNSATATTLADSGGCQPSDTVLCLRGGRFRIESGRTSLVGYLPGVIVTENEGSAVMYYVSATKWELMVNVQPRTGRYWFSASGLTEGREYDISVTDLSTGQIWTFTLPESNPRVTNAPLSLID